VRVPGMVRIGCGAGFAGDRLEPAVDLVRRGDLDWLVLECLAERTIALGRRTLLHGGPGYDALLLRRMELLAPVLAGSGTRVVTNAGSADPHGAAVALAELFGRCAPGIVTAAVTGDDVMATIDPCAPAWEDGQPLEAHGELVSANAYLGADHLLPAIDTGAQVVVAGRVADPSLSVAPLMAGHGWGPADWDLLARGTAVGHLLECGAQVTGGYHADPPHVTVDGLASVGYPLADVASDGSAVVTKLDGTGGRVDLAVVTEQLLYEVLDPNGYLTPDVAADFTTVRLQTVGPDRVAVAGAVGRARPADLKVSVGYRAGWRCEAEISYAGATASSRARLAGDIVRRRLERAALRGLRIDVLGADSMLDCRLRVAAIAAQRRDAEDVGHEVTALYTTGPSGGGGVRVLVEELLGVVSTTVARDAVDLRVSCHGGAS
jgi:hypothetical protein